MFKLFMVCKPVAVSGMMLARQITVCLPVRSLRRPAASEVAARTTILQALPLLCIRSYKATAPLQHCSKNATCKHYRSQLSRLILPNVASSSKLPKTNALAFITDHNHILSHQYSIDSNTNSQKITDLPPHNLYNTSEKIIHSENYWQNRLSHFDGHRMFSVSGLHFSVSRINSRPVPLRQFSLLNRDKKSLGEFPDLSALLSHPSSHGSTLLFSNRFYHTTSYLCDSGPSSQVEVTVNALKEQAQKDREKKKADLKSVSSEQVSEQNKILVNTVLFPYIFYLRHFIHCRVAVYLF